MFENLKICDNDKCITFYESLRAYGYVEEGILFLCNDLTMVENFLTCSFVDEYECYKVKHKFEGDCELRKSFAVPSPTFYYSDDFVFFYRLGTQQKAKFFLSESERKSLVQEYYPEDDNFLLKALKSDYTRYYYFFVHLLMILIALWGIFLRCKWKYESWQFRLNQIDEEKALNRIRDREKLQDLETSINLLRSELDAPRGRRNKKIVQLS